MPSARTLLVLGRISNLPTVWSNCLAAWLLSGSGDGHRFAQLTAGASLLYIAGMYLNDAFDAEFDRQHRPERPIPRGAITPRLVWGIGWGLMIAGYALVAALGAAPAGFGLLLVGCILAYDAIHKLIALSPVLMAGCRVLLFITAASTADRGVTGLALWTSLALGAYIIGLSYLARRESNSTLGRLWPLGTLALPLGLAALVNDAGYRTPAALLGLVVMLWIFRCLRNLWGQERPNVGRAVSGLLAGIVGIDWLAVADQPRSVGLVFVGLFLVALVLQRFVPAT